MGQLIPNLVQLLMMAQRLKPVLQQNCSVELVTTSMKRSDKNVALGDL